MTTGKRIEAARREAGMTQAKLGARIGVTNHCISMWERDLRKPKYETLARIAGALNVPVSKLMGGNMFSPKRGEWYTAEAHNGYLYWNCNQCHGHFTSQRSNFCPNCGADMRRGEDANRE